jgi:hypothetical protein
MVTDFSAKVAHCNVQESIVNAYVSNKFRLRVM